MNKKFELLLDDTIEVFGRKLFRIKAKINFGSVKVGEIGGYIEKEENLSEHGDAWVCGDARVYGNALVYGNARVKSPKITLFSKIRGPASGGLLTQNQTKCGRLAVSMDQAKN
ncbi:hypothetical protein [Bacteroides stercoris]|uniref:hypothetical protein n=1 Tax=Bacteroides stercoris TaxID=46506 RepID=UPI00195F73AC|nr:hypothetical protein [Bacteroides stercoris]